ncbi:MAG: HAD family hydrolase [Gammaproteobacteria bacterium]|jgi:putative hydrolase of the HAD superfamily
MSIDLEAVRVVVFDLGRVLIDIQPARCLAHWARHANVSAQALEREFVHDPHYEQFERGEIEFRDYASHLRATLALQLHDDVLETGWNALLGEALPQASAAVAAASARFPSFVFSNSNVTHESVWRHTHAELLAPLQQIFVSSSLGMRKPEARAYRCVAEAIGVAPAEILFFDDLAENVAASRAVGYQAVQVRGPRDILDVIG